MFADELVIARTRRETLARVHAEISRELRGAPHNAPPQAHVTYVGGLSRARRLVQHLYRAALHEEEEIVMDGSKDLFAAAVQAGWAVIPATDRANMTREAFAVALRAAAQVYAEAAAT